MPIVIGMIDSEPEAKNPSSGQELVNSASLCSEGRGLYFVRMIEKTPWSCLDDTTLILMDE